MIQNYPKLLGSFKLGNIRLKNRTVMAPMTRSRAIHNIPNDLMVRYYADRAEAGLIITEGISPSPNGLGYARIPGIYNREQVEAWKDVTQAVHDRGGKIFAQLMHTGRISHPLNLPQGAEVIGASAIGALITPMYTDQEGMQPLPVPRQLSTEEVLSVIEEFVRASKYAIEAGFDGVELHGANGYLIDQFLNPASNDRNDKYGGSPYNRNRFAIELAGAVVKAIGSDKVGIRLSPFGAFNEMTSTNETTDQFITLASELSKARVVYIHIVDHSSMGTPPVSNEVKQGIRKAFDGAVILSGGYDGQRAEADLQDNKGDLVAFGRPFLANPDLITKIAHNRPFTQPDPSTFYTPGEKGYNDYPVMEEVEMSH